MVAEGGKNRLERFFISASEPKGGGARMRRVIEPPTRGFSI